MNLENRFLRLSETHTTWHLNARAPQEPQQGLTVCGLTTNTPVYASAVYGLGKNPASVPCKCIPCHNPDVHSFMPKTEEAE